MRRRDSGVCIAACVAFTIVYIGLTGWVLPKTDRNLAAAEFATQISRQHPDDMELLVYRTDMKPFAFYLDKTVTRIESIDVLENRFHQLGSLHVLTFAENIPQLATLGQVKSLATMTGRPKHLPLKHPPLVFAELTTSNSSVESTRPPESQPTDLRLGNCPVDKSVLRK